MNTTALSIPERAKAAIAYDGEQQLVTKAESSKHITAITNADGREQVHRARLDLKNARIEIEKRGKAARADANAFRDAVIAEEKRLIDIIEPEETRLARLQTAWDSRIESERQAKVNAEQERQAAIQRRIHAFSETLKAAALCARSADIAHYMDQVDSVVVDESFAEFQETAADRKSITYEHLKKMHEAAVAREHESERLAKERAEFDKQRAEQAERDRKRQEAEQAERHRVSDIRGRISHFHGVAADAMRQKMDAKAIATYIANVDSHEIDDSFAEFKDEAQREKDAAIAGLRELHSATIEREAEDKRLRDEARRVATERAELEERQRAEREAREAQERKEREEREEAHARERAAEEERRRNYRPTFDEIVTVVAKHYEKDEDTVRTWIAEPKGRAKAAA